MVEARKDRDKEPAADNAAGDLSHLADASARLFAQQAAAVAAMTAYGITVAAQVTGMMLGSLRGPASSGNAQESALRDPAPAPATLKPAGEVVELRPRAPKAAEIRPAPAPEARAKPVNKAARTVGSKRVPAKSQAAKTAQAAATIQTAARDGDDLKRISGIGPRLQQELNGRGIWHYTDIATLSKAAVRKLDTELGLEGRIVRDDWAGQAKALSGGKG